MKNLILAIFASLALFCATLTPNTFAGTKSEVNITSPQNEYVYVRVFENGVWMVYVYDGPGGKLVNVFVEGND